MLVLLKPEVNRAPQVPRCRLEFLPQATLHWRIGFVLL